MIDNRVIFNLLGRKWLCFIAKFDKETSKHLQNFIFLDHITMPFRNKHGRLSSYKMHVKAVQLAPATVDRNRYYYFRVFLASDIPAFFRDQVSKSHFDNLLLVPVPDSQSNTGKVFKLNSSFKTTLKELFLKNCDDDSNPFAGIKLTSIARVRNSKNVNDTSSKIE